MAEQRHDSAVLTVDGSPLAADNYARLTGLRVDESVQLPDAFELRFEDAYFKLFDQGLFTLGTKVDIAMKAEADPVRIMSGEVTSIAVDQGASGRHELVVSGFDVSHRMSKVPKRRTFQNMSDADVASMIAAEYSMEADVDSTSKVHDYILQANESDYGFLRRRASLIGFDLWVTEKTMHFKQKPSGATTPPALRWGDNLLRLKVRFSESERTDEVEARGWDPLAKKVISAVVSDGDVGTDAPAAAQLASAARSAFGTVRRYAGQFPVVDQEHAEAVARSLILRATGEEVLVRGEAQGNPDIDAGAEVSIEGVGDRLSGRYRVTSVQHTYGSGRPYATRFVCGGKHANGIADLLGRGTDLAMDHGWTGLVVGQVTNNDDPEKLCRVKVKFPTLSDEHESTWARLATPGGGSARGLQWVPEVNDEVLIGFELGDTTRPVVLGGLWSRADQPPQSDLVHDGRVDGRLLASRKNHRLVFVDDTTSSVELRLGDSECLLHLEKGSSVFAGEDEIVVKAAKIEMTASRELKLRAPKVSIEADGELTVKGQPIRLN